MALATADAGGVPSVRMVLLKGYDERGYIFYTNYDSRKAAELANGHAALCMYWEPLQRQVSTFPSLLSCLIFPMQGVPVPCRRSAQLSDGNCGHCCRFAWW